MVRRNPIDPHSEESVLRRIDLSGYAEEHRSELKQLLKSEIWQDTINSGLIGTVDDKRTEPGETIDYIDTVVNQLIGSNEDRVKNLIARGNEDQEYLFHQLSRWPADLGGGNPVLSFVGFNVTADCNFDPKCTYCNQPEVEATLDSDEWKAVIEDITASNHPEGTYMYITGGEPLTLGEELWGDDGLIRFASKRRAAVNVNTNAMALTPDIALHMIKAGLSKLHISLDSADSEIQNYLFGGDRFEQVLEGIYNVQLARDIVGTTYPVMHTNCVLTNKNLDGFPQLFELILEKHKQTVDGDDPFYNDLFPHVIPVGGSSNDALRPTEKGFRRFYEKIWPEVTRRWDSYQEERGVPDGKKGILFGYFSNPLLRVQHKGGLDAYVNVSERGRYGALALPEYCYVAPTQASFAPDGNQYRCGSHAIRRIQPLGNITERGVFDNIRAGIPGLDNLPNENDCYGCALATLYINQSVEGRLKETVKALIGETV